MPHAIAQPIRPLAGAHPGQWDAWTDPRPGTPPTYAQRAAERRAAFAQSREFLDPIRAALGLKLDPAFEAGVADMLERPAWVRGCVCMHDALALAEFVRGARPRRVLEIGTASGFSAAVMLWAMEATGRGSLDNANVNEPWLHSFDIFDKCYFDQARGIGSAAAEMTPRLARHLALHTGGSRHAARALGAGGSHHAGGARFELAFIDACHDHPWPTLDLLWIAPLLAPGAWVVLHDISYARILDAKRAREGRPPKRSEYGPEALFEAWPFEKVVGDGWAGNIGAIRVDDPAAVTAELLRASLERHWEVEVGPQDAAIARD